MGVAILMVDRSMGRLGGIGAVLASCLLAMTACGIRSDEAGGGIVDTNADSVGVIGGDGERDLIAEVADAGRKAESCMLDPRPGAFHIVSVRIEPETSPSEVERIMALLAPVAGDGTITYVDTEATYAEFVEYYAGEEEVLAIVRPEDLPTVIRVTEILQADADAVEATAAAEGFDVERGTDPAECRDEAGALEALCDQAPRGDLRVWMEVGVDQAAVDGAAAWLEAQPLATDVRYLDTEATYAEFVEYYTGNDNVVELVEPEQLPTSFAVTVPDDADPDAIHALVEGAERIPAVSSADERPVPGFELCDTLPLGRDGP